ncbi:MAG: putative peptidoglycan binding protein, partial [Novosphingobium sp.]|nr:putative peptidoglycan binding protein [Novosphingobium sp.]
GRAESHGCVRLTNWDVARLAQMVSAKTALLFEA